MRNRRQFEIGSIYHVYNRGVDRRTIFKNNQDYSRFILGLYYYNRIKPGPSIWTNIKDRPQKVFLPLVSNPAVSDTAGLVDSREPLVEILAFCLMSNHYHLILREITDNGITFFMQKMGGYSRYFNKQNKRSGALFEGRYKDVHVKTDKQLLILFNYVHTNPVEIIEPGWKTTGVQDELEALRQQATYPWTSYYDYVDKPKFPLVTDRDFYLDLLGGSDGCRQSVEDWIKFKAETASLPKYLEKL